MPQLYNTLLKKFYSLCKNLDYQANSVNATVIVTSSAHEGEYLHSMYAPARALSRIVLSLTNRMIRYNQRIIIIY